MYYETQYLLYNLVEPFIGIGDIRAEIEERRLTRCSSTAFWNN
jgi:hypothetical protein